MILFAPHLGQLATSSDILLWLDVDFQIEMYLAESSQFYSRRRCRVKGADFDRIIDTPGLVGWLEMTAQGSGADRIVGAKRPGVCYSDAAYAAMT